jgi:hypothetical protein
VCYGRTVCRRSHEAVYGAYDLGAHVSDLTKVEADLVVTVNDAVDLIR